LQEITLLPSAQAKPTDRTTLAKIVKIEISNHSGGSIKIKKNTLYSDVLYVSMIERFHSKSTVQLSRATFSMLFWHTNIVGV
jgi:hypothetical protein